MISNITLAVLFTDYIFLYLGCIVDNWILRVLGGLCLLTLAIATVLPEKKKMKG